MNFTREPIIETIITPKDGYKIVVRSSKGAGYEEYTVDAVEVVSFGSSLFFRNLERPKCFLVPVSDYEIVEAKETRVVLKNVPLERTIKIGGGREHNPSHNKPTREVAVERSTEEQHQEGADKQVVSENIAEHRRKDRKRHRRRRGGHDDRMEGKPHGNNNSEDDTQQPVSPPTFTSLFPPPTTLISDTISRYKEFAISETNFPPKPSAVETPEVESFTEDRKDTHREDLADSEEPAFPSYPDNLEDSSELFIETKDEDSLKTHKKEFPFFDDEEKT